MIANERTQNIIVVTVIITALVGSMFLVNNALYYGGSYSLAGRLEVSLVSVTVGNLDSNVTNPFIRLRFNLATDAVAEGNVRITFMGATVNLNDDLLSYISFSYIPAIPDQYLTTGFNRNYNMTDVVDEVEDQNALSNAQDLGVWRWDIRFRYSFIVFDELGTIMWQFLDFNTTSTIFL